MGCPSPPIRSTSTRVAPLPMFKHSDYKMLLKYELLLPGYGKVSFKNPCNKETNLKKLRNIFSHIKGRAFESYPPCIKELSIFLSDFLAQGQLFLLMVI